MPSSLLSGARVGKFVVKLPIVDPARGAWAGTSFPGRPCRSGWFAHGFRTPNDTVWLAGGGTRNRAHELGFSSLGTSTSYLAVPRGWTPPWKHGVLLAKGKLASCTRNYQHTLTKSPALGLLSTCRRHSAQDDQRERQVACLAGFVVGGRPRPRWEKAMLARIDSGNQWGP